MFDESVFPFSTTTTPTSTPDLDQSSMFPTNLVVEPPLPVFPAGTAPPWPLTGLCPSSLVACHILGPVHYSGLAGSPSRLAPAHVTGPRSATPTPAPPTRFAQPVCVYQRRAHHAGPGPATPAPPTRFAQLVRIYHRRTRLAPLPPSAPVAPSSPGHLCHRWHPLRRRHRHRRQDPILPVLRRRCTTHRFFTDTRVMFTLW